MIALLQLRPYTGDRVVPSPNRGAREAPAIEGIVLHATADEGDEALSLSWMRSPKSRVSCHLMVSRTGCVTRLVGDQQRAWHAGLAWWRGTSDVNSITLGIEIANRNDGEPYTRAQYRRVADIVAYYCGQGLSLDDVVGHHEISVGRKTDPRGWDWDHFRAMVQYRLRAVDGEPPLALPPAATEPGVAVVSVVPTGEGQVARPPEVALPKLRVPRVTEPKPVLSAAPPVMPRIAAPAVVPRIAAPPTQRVPVITTPKPVLRSRTLWLAMMTVLASGGMLAADALDLAHRLGIALSEDLTKWALFGVGVVNIILRLRTTQPLTCSQRGDCSPPDVPVERVHEPARVFEGRVERAG